MNNKGFAITTIIFGVLILFCLLLFSMLGILSTYRSNLNSLINNHNGARGLVTDAYEGFSKDFEYNGNYQTFEASQSGYYKVELWGAQGGDYNTTYTGGLGGYTSGYIYLSTSEKLYIYTGKAGVTSFNGGDGKHNIGTGGGATDVRLVNGASDDATSLNSRIMVAGGGGGAYWHTLEYGGSGGSGGGLYGGRGTGLKNITPPLPGTQTSGGTGDSHGSFGFGGTSTNTGGDGYYGGGSAGGGTSTYGISGSAGGSSFISGYAGVNAIDANRVHTNNTLHYSSKYFINSTMSSGINASNGKAKITYIGKTPKRVNTKLDNVRYVRDCMNGSSVDAGDHWVELQVIKNGINIAKNKTITGTVAENSVQPYSNIVNGDIDPQNYGIAGQLGQQCITVDLGSIQEYVDEIFVLHYWADARTYNNNVTSVSSDNSTWTTVIAYDAPETVNGKRVNAWNQ